MLPNNMPMQPGGGVLKPPGVPTPPQMGAQDQGGGSMDPALEQKLTALLSKLRASGDVTANGMKAIMQLILGG